MKKNLFMVAAVALMAMVSCNKIENNNGGEEVVVPTIPFEFTAYADGTNAPVVEEPEARTTLNTDSGSPKTHWLATDKISVNGSPFNVDKNSEYGAGARFIGELPQNFSGTYQAVYPYGAGDFNSLTIPDVQTAKGGDFDQTAVIAVAESQTNTLEFKNVTSLLKFQVSAKCEKITITSDNYLAGKIKVDAITSEVVDGKNVTNIVYTILDGKNEIHVEGPFVVGEYYYVAVLPGVKSNFTVRVDDYYSKGAKSVTPKRNVIMDMKVLPEPLRKVYVKNDLNWENLSIYAWDENNNPLLGEWPGRNFEISETINNKKYNVFDFKDINNSPKGVLLVGTASNGKEDVEIQTSDITSEMKGNKYYRLSIREGLYKEIDPNDITTFAYRIYVYMQKGDEYVDPYLHIWNTNGITNTNWNSQKKLTDSYEYPSLGNKKFYYYEPPVAAYASMNFIVTLQNGGKQTGDIKGSLDSDYYVCAWAGSGSNYGLYARKGSNTKDNGDITKSTIGVDPELCY